MNILDPIFFITRCSTIFTSELSEVFRHHFCCFTIAPLFVLDKSTGASTVKWTTLDPCSGLSESDPKLHTNFDFYETEIHKHLESI
jgi:hypothetical protein